MTGERRRARASRDGPAPSTARSLLCGRLCSSALVCVVGIVPAVAVAQFAPRPLSRFDQQKAEWLLRERLSCLGCHRLEGQGGAIGPDLTDVADRRSAEFIFRMITHPQATQQGSRMPRVPMPAEWARLVASYLAQGKSAAAVPADPSQPEDATPLSGIQDPGALYQRLCAACHGVSGAGDGFNAANLPVRPTAHADSAYLSSRPDDTLFDGVFARPLHAAAVSVCWAGVVEGWRGRRVGRSGRSGRRMEGRLGARVSGPRAMKRFSSAARAQLQRAKRRASVLLGIIVLLGLLGLALWRRVTAPRPLSRGFIGRTSSERRRAGSVTPPSTLPGAPPPTAARGEPPVERS
ncbi:MAG: c-type cytochrome [Gemmatimonadetes bacterium]|nr:c-type cytochrome [Gemmatimonadota bacterium]